MLEGFISCCVNETCLSGDHRTFMVPPNDKDSHNPILIHVTPADLTYNERRTYLPRELRVARKERTKEQEKQKANKRKSHYGGDDGYFQSSAASSSWRPRYRGVYTSKRRR